MLRETQLFFFPWITTTSNRSKKNSEFSPSSLFSIFGHHENQHIWKSFFSSPGPLPFVDSFCPDFPSGPGPGARPNCFVLRWRQINIRFLFYENSWKTSKSVPCQKKRRKCFNWEKTFAKFSWKASHENAVGSFKEDQLCFFPAF